MVLIKNLKKFATTPLQSYVVNMDKIQRRDRVFVPLKFIMTSDTNITMSKLNSLRNYTIMQRDKQKRDILLQHPNYKRGESGHNQFDSRFNKYDEKLKLLRSLKVLLQKYEEHKVWSSNSVREGMLDWAEKAKHSHWKPGGKGYLKLQNKYKNVFL